jgi:alkylhydroperoxidase family enzyme
MPDPEAPPAVDDATSRVAPLPRPWSDEDAAAIGRWGHPAATYPPLLLTRVLQRHPGLADRVRHLGEGLYVDGRLDGRTRTLAILRTCAGIASAYEWGGQAAFWGPLTGVSPAEADALTVADPTRADVASSWSALDVAVIEAVDELERAGTLGDARWAELRLHLDDEQIIELVIVAGWYRLIASTCNALDLGREDWMRPWPGAEPVGHDGRRDA